MQTLPIIISVVHMVFGYTFRQFFQFYPQICEHKELGLMVDRSVPVKLVFQYEIVRLDIQHLGRHFS